MTNQNLELTWIGKHQRPKPGQRMKEEQVLAYGWVFK